MVLVKVRAANHQVVDQRTVRNPFARAEHGRGIKVAELLVNEGVDVVLVGERLDGKAPSYVLGKARTRVVVTKSRTLAQALAEQSVEGVEEADVT